MMIKICKEELDTILENHKHWLKKDVKGWEKMRADLSNADLSNADLSNADLREARMFNTDLSRSGLFGSKLDNADMHNVNLSGAKLRGADLHYTSFYEANLCNADLRDADLRGACLYKANLTEADIRGADIRGADLDKAMLPDLEIMNSILPICCPEEGSFIGWKKALVRNTQTSPCACIEYNPVIVKLIILNTAKRSSGTARKCRCSEAEVLDIQSLGGTSLPKDTIAHSRYDFRFTYKVGQKLYVEDFDDNRWNECSTGIHFFITRQEAVDYYI